MKLTSLAQKGEIIPLTLPTSLIPPTKAAKLGLAPPTAVTSPRVPSPVMPGKSVSLFVHYSSTHHSLIISTTHSIHSFMCFLAAYITNICSLKQSLLLSVKSLICLHARSILLPGRIINI